MAKITPLTYSETAAFCSQMAMILKAGISSYEGVSIMLEDARNQGEKELLTVINDTLVNTGSLYMALDATGAFPNYMMSMIQIGEQTGHVDDVMASLSTYYTNEASLATTVKNAITYPCVMVFMMIAVILVLITKVMPIFNQVFIQLGTEMTGVSRGVLALGNFLNAHSAILLIILALILALGIYLFRSKNGQKKMLAFSGKFRMTSMLADQIATYRFANGMSLTLSSGLTPEECLDLTSNLISDGAFKNKLKESQAQVKTGVDLCESLTKAGIFNGLQARMMTIASRTGSMDEVMSEIADQYEDEIDARISKALSSIEPTLVVILSVAVGIILLSVMLPLISIMATL